MKLKSKHSHRISIYSKFCRTPGIKSGTFTILLEKDFSTMNDIFHKLNFKIKKNDK